VRSAEARIALLFCVLAALRVLVFCAAFPLFSNVDEQGHFDLVCKYARGHVPRGLESWDEEAARAILLYGSPEYFEKGAPGPREPRTAAEREAFEREVSRLAATVNHETTQPPVYYVVAAGWYRLGISLGLHGAQAVYWIRWLNAALCGAITWIAYLFASTWYPRGMYLRLGVPLLVACFPQDVFYAMNNDVLLPLAGGAAMLGLAAVACETSKGPAFHAAVGLAVAATILVKFSSVGLFLVAAGVAVFAVSSRARGAALIAAAAIPIGAWLARNALVLGDVTGSAEKVRVLGWTLKPPGRIFHHPLFTPSGMLTFWSETMATFWRGEIVWGLTPLASPGWDRFYAASSFVLIALAVIAAFTWRREEASTRRAFLLPSLALVVLSVGFLAAISLMYDFGDCFYPSRVKPFLTSGRLALAALIPFAALYVSGLDALVPRKAPEALRWALLVVPLVLLTASELTMSRMAFSSAYNWFHLP